jgi:hypothetical protein
MGKYNSSITRVAPVFDALMDRDATGRSWLPHLLRLGSRSAGRIEQVQVGSLRSGHPRWWGKQERRFEPPPAFLRWLVANAQRPSSHALWGSGLARQKRELLVARHPGTIAEALGLLEARSASRVWYVLEGRSQPDACLETEALLLVIEGKRTERHATTLTTWMGPSGSTTTSSQWWCSPSTPCISANDVRRGPVEGSPPSCAPPAIRQ